MIETEEQKRLFKNHEHYIGTFDIDGVPINATRLRAWIENPQRKFICVFCGTEPITGENGFMYCPNCKQYKGIMPDCPKV